MSNKLGSITLLGLGSMGASLARRLLDPDYQLHIWNRTANRPVIKELVNDGANYLSSAVEAFQASQIIILCLLDYPTIYETLADVEDKSCLESKTIINLTNGTPKDARDMEHYLNSDWKVARDGYFDGGIMATPPLIGSDSAFIFCSGGTSQGFMQPDDGHSVHDVLSRFGRVEYLGPEVDSSALYDLSLLAGMYGMFGGALTAIALLSKRKSKDLPSISETVARHLIPWLQAVLPSLEDTAGFIEQNDTESHGHGNAMRCIAMQNVTRACDEEDVDAGPLRYLLQTYEKVVEKGAGD